jgi:hypothetical protein
LLHFHILTFWKKPVPVLPQVLRRLLTSSAQPILSINLNYLKIIGSFSTKFLYLAVPHVYFGMHSSKKRFHSFNHRLVFRKKGGNFLSPIPIPTYDIATQKSTSFFWKIEMHEVCVSKCFSVMHVDCPVHNAVSATSHHNSSLVQLLKFSRIWPSGLENGISTCLTWLTLTNHV